ncbi:MAG: FAD-dependent oxidoreductase [Candidatus Methylomirabilis sp.]|nr:FAD-dependent oxidoreductase [Candidatus Methylomirabilis sp.]
METWREQNWEYAKSTSFDVMITGGGVNGACLYHQLCSQGYKVLLIDKGDFAGGSSQSSGMMIWGGLLYLRNLDVCSVYRLSRARDAMIKLMSDRVSPCLFRYVPSSEGGRNGQIVQAGLYLYWLAGMLRRRAPFSQRVFGEAVFIRDVGSKGSFVYEEGVLKGSDCRFVLRWIAPFQAPEHVPLNYCAVEDGSYSAKEQLWRLHLKDTLYHRETEATARCVVNCAGVWVDKVNQDFGVRTPYKHLLSKGVYLGLQRHEAHHTPLIFDMEQHGDVVTYLPWGPIALLGPTETLVRTAEEGYDVSEEDARFLLEQAAQHLRTPVNKTEIISLRCGVRPLAVPTSFRGDCYPLDISRRHRIVKDSRLPWISLYGGKITGCIETCRRICAELSRLIPRAVTPVTPGPVEDEVELTSFPGLAQKVPSVEWCKTQEFCLTLEDYLRRRTNISQWVAREGLGRNDENLGAVEKIALSLCNYDQLKVSACVKRYREQVNRRFDSLIART